LPAPTTVHVPLAESSYDITIGRKLLGNLGQLYKPRARQCCFVITSEPLRELYGQRVLGGLEDGGWTSEAIVVPDGEAAKTIETVTWVCRTLAQAGADRGAVIFALGGGAVGDLAGFVAAVYLRGVAFIQVPSTLLSQADASVGGKVAVDLPEGKNLVGSFHQPEAVFIDTDTLDTLPARHMRAGIVEVLKHAVIADGELFAFIEDRLEDILAKDAGALQHLLACNCQIKVDIVAADPFDRGVRGLLNLGHTIGHAVEAAADEWSIYHGEAVALGMISESRLAVDRGLCSQAAADRLETLINRLNLQIDLRRVDVEMARTVLRRDKKIVDGTLHLPLMHDIGETRIVDDVSLDELDSILCDALRNEI
jgi:3-dehydroquinate synthase